jgi:hypothetical protein
MDDDEILPSDEMQFIRAAVAEETTLMDELDKALTACDPDRLVTIARKLVALEKRIAAGPDRESAA